MPTIAKKASKDIKYLGRDFDSLKQGLIEFTKNYYPNTYNDFNESSPGSLFIDLAAYVGDVLSYYIDSQLKENLVLYAQERKNILAIANAFGYKPKLSIPSQVSLDVFQLLPASGSGVNATADFNYALTIPNGMIVRAPQQDISFICQSSVDFSTNNVFSPVEVSVYSIDNTGNPTYFLAKKQVKAISATTKTQDFVIDGVEKFKKILLTDTVDSIIGIQSIVDSNGNIWYEVPYLAQDTIFEKVENTAYNNPDTAVYSAETPYLLKLKRVPRRFVARVVESGIEVQFGSGTSTMADEELLATPENIGLTLPTGKEDIDASIDSSNPLITTAYGIAPANVTLTVTYLVGGGIASNVPSNTITEIINVGTLGSTLPSSTPTLNNAVINSLAVNNPSSALGGRSQETIEEIRQNALAQLASQNRAVTREDYIIRAYAMPNTFGSVAKVFISTDEQNNISTEEVMTTVANPLAMNMYVLGYDNNKNLIEVNTAIKENLKVYLSEYRMLTDSINIRNAFIINIGIDFDIIPQPNYNANEVLVRCIQALKDFFAIDNWQINQPILYNDLYSALNNVDGVQSVEGIRIKNLNNVGLGYSNIFYDVDQATKNRILYPSLDPSIFEVKYPDKDIRGKVVTY
jgi:hypothetical protein